MKKYWKLLTIAIISVLVISTFYIQKAIANESPMEFVLDTYSGDEAELGKLAISGWYQGQYNESFTITSDGIEYHSHDSLVEQLVRTYSPKTDQLIEGYRGFMRGKTMDLRQLYEDEKLLAFATVESDWDGQSRYNDHTFKIDVLQKGEKERFTFKKTVPNQQDYNYMYVVDVQIKDGQLSIFTRNDIVSEKHADKFGQSDFRVYRFDIASEKLISEDSLLYVEGQDGNKSFNGEIISASTPMSQTDYVVLKKTEYVETQSEFGEMNTEETGKEYMLYNLSTMEKKELNIPEEMSMGSEVYSEFMLGTSIYFIHRTQDGLAVKSYNINDQQKNEFTIELPNDEGDTPSVIAKGERIYIMGGGLNEVPIMVYNAQTGQSLYEGTYKLEGKQVQDSFISVDGIFVD